MIYITDDDLKTESYQRFIDDSIADYQEAKNQAEKQAIGFVKTLLRGRYDVDTIFDDANPVKDDFLIEIIAKITFYKLISRNAARKVPSDAKEHFDWAVKQLKEINAGKLNLSLPKATNENGNVVSDSIWGNFSNKNFYI